MSVPCCVILITAPNPQVGQQLAEALLEQRLAACVNLLPGVQSFFTWQGKASQESETLLVVKTRLELFDVLAQAVRGLHPYDLPEIIALPILTGLPEYLDWIEKETSQPHDSL